MQSKMITGPVKFSFKTGEIEREALAFWCVMIPREMFDELGLLDEIFSPGMGEDGDFCIKADLKGYPLVQVPIDGSHKFKEEDIYDKIEIPPIPWQVFPIMHKGSGTFGWLDAGGLIERNKQILDERYGAKVNPKYSIIIPTYNHCEDLLKPCLESIIKYTDLTTAEVIVVANGCVDNTKEYVESLGHPFKLIWEPEALGYTKATNIGIKASTGQYCILLNNDTVLLDQPKSKWIDMLEAPFNEKKSMGLTGPLQLFDEYAGQPVLIFFCVMIKREVFDKIGLLDEIFTPGGGEDIDFTIRARNAGYDAQVLESTTFNGQTNVSTFPIWHVNNQTFVHIPEYTNYIVKRNGLINCQRYNRNIKLNLGAGGIEYPGYLSVDLHDKRANILMDITNLDFPEESVTEILASHVFEHLNPYHVERILAGWFKVLKPGGKLVMEMPNIEELCRRFVTASKRERYGILNAVYGSVNTTDTGNPDDITSPHLFGWWPEAIWDFLTGTGFIDIQFMNEKIPHPESNFRVECVKPSFVKSEPISKKTKFNLNHELLKKADEYVYDEIFTRDIYQTTDMTGKVVIDCGANIGYFALKSLELGADFVLAIEAEPTIYSKGLSVMLSHAISENKADVLNAALSDKSGQSVTISNKHVGSKVGEPGDIVSTITLEDAIKLTVDKVGYKEMILKMDIEGSEMDVLNSTSNFVLRNFSIIYIEFHGNGCNPKYPTASMGMQRLVEAGFDQVHTHPESLDCFTQKWVRIG